jgi:hypothetical protein
VLFRITIKKSICGTLNSLVICYLIPSVSSESHVQILYSCHKTILNKTFFYQGPLGGWQAIFLIAAATYALTALPYLFVATGKLQAWNDDEKKEENSSVNGEIMPMNDVNHIA